MFGSVILDVALGLAFLFLLLSLLVTGINELIESRLKWRAKDLELGIRQLLDSAEGPAGEALVKNLYEHPLIGALFAGQFKSGSRDLPSYIPSRNFALALLDLAVPGMSKPASGAAGTTPPPPVAGAPAGGTPSLQALRDAVKASPALTEYARTALVALIDAAGTDVAQARRNIEDWFDGAMDRVSGWFKRQIQWITFGVGCVVAVALNADTFAVADALTRDPVLRQSVVTAAEAESKGKPPGGTAQPAPTVGQITDQINRIRGFGWPVGWDRQDPRTMPPCTCYGAWALKGVGWLVTACAIALGAPFWFDVLNRIIIIRSTVRPKEKSPPEPPVNPPKK